MLLIRRGLVKIDYLARLGTKDSYKAKFEALADALDDAPFVDAEPVVRCKDCVLHGKCITEETFEACGKYDGFCCVGKRRYDDARNTPNHV